MENELVIYIYIYINIYTHKDVFSFEHVYFRYVSWNVSVLLSIVPGSSFRVSPKNPNSETPRNPSPASFTEFLTSHAVEANHPIALVAKRLQ